MSVKVKVCRTVGCAQRNVDTARFCSKCKQSLVGVVPTEPEDSTAQDDKPADVSVPKQAESNAPGRGDAGASANTGSLSQGYMLQWPWGQMPVGDGLFVGRVPPVPEGIARRIEEEYNNVSRMHAELFFESGQLYVRDLGSMNGTFVNPDINPNVNRKPIEPRKPRLLRSGDKIRFGAKLEATVNQFTN